MSDKIGTEIFDEKDMYVKRFWGGEDKGMSFVFDMNMKEMTQKELAQFISKLIDYMFVWMIKGDG